MPKSAYLYTYFTHFCVDGYECDILLFTIHRSIHVIMSMKLEGTKKKALTKLFAAYKYVSLIIVPYYSLTLFFLLRFSLSLSSILALERSVKRKEAKLVKMGIYSLITGRRGPSGFGSATTAEEVTQGIDATRLTAIITGSYIYVYTHLHIYVYMP